MPNCAWLDKNDKIIEPEFCRAFLEEFPMKCIQGHFCTVDGIVQDENIITQRIYEKIMPYVPQNTAKRVAQIFNTMKLAAFSEFPAIQTDRIHVANGTYFLDGSFSEEKDFCINRLSVAYRPETSPPNRWLQYLAELLDEDDIAIVQEFMGYCLLPTTKAQKMLVILGKGGEGKSRLSSTLKAIFGQSMNTSSIQKVEKDKFARADLEHKLLMVDDDMDMEKLSKTNLIKSIVTAEVSMDLERKGEQSVQGLLYVRFLCLGNGALTALHDRSKGFFRRQIVLTTKDKPADRVDDPYLAEKLIAEKEGIFLWMLEGLHLLIERNYQFSISKKAAANMENIVRETNNVIDFLDSEGYIELKADYTASTSQLYEVYCDWCKDNAESPFSLKSFSNRMGEIYLKYNLADSDRIILSDGKRCRGYEGIGVIPTPRRY